MANSIIHPKTFKQQAKLELVETCVRELQNETSIAPPLLPHDMRALLEIEQQLRAARNDQIDKTEARKRLTRQYREAKAYLRLRIRHAYQLVRRKTQLRGNCPTSIITSYGLQADGSIPHTQRYLPYPIQIAQDLIQAETNANSQGYQILTDPTPQELQEHIETAEHLEAQRSLAYTAEANSVQTTQTILATFDHLIIKIMRYYRYALSDATPQHQRKVMQALGFSYHKAKDPQPQAA